MNILALDIGKFNTVYCDYICENGKHDLGKVKTTPKAIHDLIVNKEPKRVVMEVSEIAGWVRHWRECQLSGVGPCSETNRIGEMIFKRMWHRCQFHLRLSFATSPSYEGGESGLRRN